MRLIKQLERLEASAAETSECVGVGLAWSDCDERVEAAQLEPGEYIAADVHMLGELCPGVERWLVRERITRDLSDLGWLHDEAGDVVGRVTAIDGSLLTLRYGASPGAAARAVGRAAAGRACPAPTSEA
jgi:hypothetical protein